jgi:ATP-dependent Lon protease
MDEPKREIKRIIAQWINGSTEGYILGFEGPPGTGKTTLAKKGISKCLKDDQGLDRPFTFIALGGSTNGSTLEGHNYTYVGSTWGRIVDSLMETQCMNPIIYIDELDKISRTEQGKELIGILIHLTDPSQNEEFMDKYFSGIKIDISKCLIIFSYNDVNKIDRVLLDRIHRIKIKALTRYDKLVVAKEHLIPEICENVGFNVNDIEIEQETLFYLIDNYTFEAGARKLKEKLFEIIREINLQYLLGNIDCFPQKITIPQIKEFFYNKVKIQVKKIPTKPSIGLVNGLYATSSGTGGITTIEAFRYLSDSRLSLELTGQQGDVMKESMRVSKTIAWNLLPNGIKDTIRREKPHGIHIHCPEAAQPKDGPSAGTAITIAMLSLLSNIPVNNEIAVTGEIDLNGNVLAIGGLEYKIEGAKTAGVKLVLCPEENRDDLNKILKSKYNPTKNCDFRIETISNIFQAIDYMLMGDNKCSNLFKKYSFYPLSNNDYLNSFKTLCDNSSELICIIDTSPDFLLLYTSKGFSTKLGWTTNDVYQKSIMKFITQPYQANLQKTLHNTLENEETLCVRLNVIKNTQTKDSIIVICNTQKIDNIISCTMRIVNNSN